MPAGWGYKDEQGKSNYIIKLKKNLYGTATGAINWYKKLTAGLIARGYHQSIHDPCLFLREDSLFVVYTDDCICFSKTKRVPDQLIIDLKNDGFLLKDEGDASDFLGVTIIRNPDTQTMTITQKGLIESILDDLGLHGENEHVKTKDVPASQILHPDKDGAERGP